MYIKLMNYTALEELENFVFECQMQYSEREIIDDPSFEWNICHHPAPRCLGGEETVLLLGEHHAIHGILQSEVYEHPCIYGWERRHLTDPKHVELFDKWMSEKSRVAGRIGALEANKIIHAEKNDKGQSVNAVKAGIAAAAEKNEQGQSVNALKRGESTAKKTRKPVLLTELNTGKTSAYPSVNEASRQLKLHDGHLSEVLNGIRKTHKGFTAQFI